MARELCIPDIGDFKEVPVIEVLVKPGDTVSAEDPLLTLESDKATMDVPAEAGGKVLSVKISVGDRVSKGDPFLELDAADAAQDTDSAAGEPAVAAPPAAREQPPGGTIGIEIPDIGDFENVPVIEVLVKPGDTVSAEDPLLTLESDKATMDVPSPADGEIVELQVSKGDKVSKGTPVGVLRTSSAPKDAAQPAPAAPTQSAPAQPAAVPPPRDVAMASTAAATSPSEAQEQGTVYASPAVWKLAREFGVDLTFVRGTGRKGRVLKEDVQAYVKGRLSSAPQAPAGGAETPQMPEIDFSQFGEVEIKPLPRITQISGANLRRNWVLAPHVTQFEEADITDLEQFRKSASVDGPKITLIPFLVKACVAALKLYPQFNASLTTDQMGLVHKKYFHVGIAVDTPAGLMVPVIRDADRKGIRELAAELRELAGKGHERKLRPEEMQGGCFTISSLGGVGGTMFTPIINLPEVAILGVSRSKMAPVWDGKEFRPRIMLPLSLSYDHRVIDGVAAAKFTNCLAELLGDIRNLAL